MAQFFRLAAMLVLLLTIALGQTSGKIRTYYIAAEEVDWDFATSGVNKMMGIKFEGYPTEEAGTRAGGKPRNSESSYVGGAIYVNLNDKQIRSKMTAQQMLEQEKEIENMARQLVATCVKK